jgi:enoyl-CoA hydratase
MPDYILTSRDDAVGIITLNRPERYNAWHHAMRMEVAAALQEFDQDNRTGAVVVTGAGDKAFGAGQDLAEAKHFTTANASGWMDDWDALFGGAIRMETPLVAAINGVAVGTAFEFALLCDVRVGYKEGRLGIPEINVGVPLTFGAWIIWDVLGKATSTELWLSGRLIDGVRGYEIGALTHLVDQEDVLSESMGIARDLAAKPRGTMQANKRRLRSERLPAFEATIAEGRRVQEESFARREMQDEATNFLARSHTTGSRI